MTDLSKITTHQLVDALMERTGVSYIVNDRSSSDYAVAVDFKRTVRGSGEAVIIICEGLF